MPPAPKPECELTYDPPPNGYTHSVCNLPGVGRIYVPLALDRARVNEVLSYLRVVWKLSQVQEINAAPAATTLWKRFINWICPKF